MGITFRKPEVVLLAIEMYPSYVLYHMGNQLLPGQCHGGGHTVPVLSSRCQCKAVIYGVWGLQTGKWHDVDDYG